MMNVTLTGIDVLTPIREVQKLDAEIGLLYSATNTGNRYPPLEWISDVSRHLNRAAVHICGRGAREELLSGELDWELKCVQRVQVNGFLELKTVEDICRMYPRLQIITQHRPENVHLLVCKAPNHQILVDASGGKGELPEEWKCPDTAKVVGFAGGLGPETIEGELPLITKVAKENSWIDMEGRLRDGSDWFDIEKAKRVLEIVELERLIEQNGARPYDGAPMPPN